MRDQEVQARLIMGDVVNLEERKKKNENVIEKVIERIREKTGFKKDIDLATGEFPIVFMMYGMGHPKDLDKDRVRVVMCERLGELPEEQCVVGAVTITRAQWEKMREMADSHFRCLKEARDTKKR